MNGIYPNAVSVDEVLVKGLNSSHMLNLLPVPKTIMATVLPPEEPWLRVDSTYPSQMRERFAVLAAHKSKVIDSLEDHPNTFMAEVELRDTVVGYLTTNYPGYFKQRGHIISSPLTGVEVDLHRAEPLMAVAALSKEDHLILLPCEKDGKGQDVYRLQAGALLFPNDWSLRSHFAEPEPIGDKYAWQLRKDGSAKAARLGRTVAEIHKGIVPHYDEHFVDKVNLMFNTMRPGKAVWRRNWGISLNSALFQHPDIEQPSLEPLNPVNMVEDGVLRSEHEGFVKLPKSGAIIFSISTYTWPVKEMLAEPTVFNALSTARANMPETMLAYRNRRQMAQVLDVVLASYPRPTPAP